MSGLRMRKVPMARVNIMIPDDLLKRIDLFAAQEGLSRSKPIRLAFLAYCEQREEGFKRELRQADIEHGMALQDRLRSEIPAWDPLAIMCQERQAR